MFTHNKRMQPGLDYGHAAKRSVRVMKKLITALVLVSASASANTFEERVNTANAAFESEEGAAYEIKLRPYIQKTIKKCAPVDSTSKGIYGKFVLVADVSPEGKIFNSMIKPETEASICFRKEFSVQILPAPPYPLISEGSAPIVVEIYIVP